MGFFVAFAGRKKCCPMGGGCKKAPRTLVEIALDAHPVFFFYLFPKHLKADANYEAVLTCS